MCAYLIMEREYPALINQVKITSNLKQPKNGRIGNGNLGLFQERPPPYHPFLDFSLSILLHMVPPLLQQTYRDNFSSRSYLVPR